MSTELTEAVEAAARAVHEENERAHQTEAGPQAWEDVPAMDQYRYREMVLPAVTAASRVLVAAAEAALSAVRDLHEAHDVDRGNRPIWRICAECSDPENGMTVPYPCGTLRAIAKAATPGTRP